MALALGLGTLTSEPAQASPLRDCFERVAVAMHPQARHRGPVVHRAKPAHRLAHRPRPRAAVSRARYILQPRACPSQDTAALMTPAPDAPSETTPREMLAMLAGPPVEDAAPTMRRASGPLIGPLEDRDVIGGPGIFDLPGLPGTPGIPDTEGPGVIAPPGPPLPGLPGGPGFPPVLTGPGPTAAVPEPGVWAMMLLGFVALGGMMRRRRSRQAA